MQTQSFSLLSAQRTLFFIVDLQERLVPAMERGREIVFNTRRLLDGAQLFRVPVRVSEQYPKGLGPTVPEVIAALPEETPVFPKLSFSIVGDEAIAEALRTDESPEILLCGIEGHVCILQSALDLMHLGKNVTLVVDACGSRFTRDYETALRRLENEGVRLTTTESVLFEWCRTADHPAFKAVSRLARETLDPEA